MVNILVNKVYGILLLILLLIPFPLMPSSAQNEEYHTHFVNSVEYDSSGERFATVSRDETVKVWDENGNLIFDRKAFVGHNASVLDASWSPDDKFLATSGVDNLVMIWNMTHDAFLQKSYFQEHLEYVKRVSWNPNQTRNIIASGSNDGAIKLYPPTMPNSNVTTAIDTLNDHEETITDLRWSANGQFLGSSDVDGQFMVYDMDNPTNKLISQMRFSSPIMSFDMDETATNFVVMTRSSIQTVSRLSGAISLFTGSTNISINCDATCLNQDVEISPDGDKIALTNRTKIFIYQWDGSEINTNELLFSIDVATELNFEPQHYVVDLSWHPDNNKLAFVAGPDILIYDTSSDQQILYIQGTIPSSVSIVLIVFIVSVLLIIVIYLVRRQLRKGAL